MEEKKTVLDYIGQSFCIFGIMILMISIFCILFGEGEKDSSTMFAFGKNAVAVSTIFEFYLLSIIITVARAIYFTDVIIKNMTIAVRTILMFGTILVVLIVFIVSFGWFPVTMWQAWIMFFVCFVISTGVSTLIAYWKEQSDNKELEQALKKMKEIGEHR